MTVGRVVPVLNIIKDRSTNMYRVLITDDEKIEREGIKFLLAQEEGEYEIHEAANGRQALNVLRSEEIDFLLTDIKMPHMDGLELASKVREEYPNLPIVIFSGYSDFAFAQEAMRYGVKDYVLKPVDPDTFHTTIGKVKAELQSIRSKKQKEEKGKNFLLQYFLQTYLYSGNEEVLKKAGEILDESNWEQWHCAILIESDKAFFDNVPDNIDEELMQGLHRNFFYLNLNTRQSVLFFSDVYCDYQLVAKHLYDILKQNYSASFHLAVSSRFEGHEALPEIMSQLEQTMEEKFYHPDVHVFNNEASDSQPVNAETQDSRLMEKISEDISRKDVEQLKKHFECLVKKYENDTRFSAMYVKFVFSNVIQELFQENQFSEERKLDHEVERLYSCTNLKQILAITQENIKEYEEFLERSMSDSRDEVASVKNYIYQHYAEDLSLETLAEKVYLSSGYLSFIFKKETGMNLNRFIRVVRMEKAKELYNKLISCGVRTKHDDTDNSPGWKFAEYEMKGVPVRIEIGPKDIENNQCVVVTRHNREKTVVSLENMLEVFSGTVMDKLKEVHDGIYDKALENRKNKTYSCKSIEEITKALNENGDGFIKAMWCGDEACEEQIKEETGVGSRCIPFEQEKISDKCVCCGRPADKMVYWGKAY